MQSGTSALRLWNSRFEKSMRFQHLFRSRNPVRSPQRVYSARSTVYILAVCHLEISNYDKLKERNAGAAMTNRAWLPEGGTNAVDGANLTPS